MNWKCCKQLIKEDYSRWMISEGKPCSLIRVVKAIASSPSFKVTFWLRMVNFFRAKNAIVYRLFLKFSIHIFRHYQQKFGIQIGWGLDVQGGLEFFHYNCVVIAGAAKIGRNVSIHQGVTIGRIFAGEKAGCPTICDNVIIFAGAKILGNVRVGRNSVIGANAVVTKDVPDNSVVAGVPAKIISNHPEKCFDEYWKKAFACDL